MEGWRGLDAVGRPARRHGRAAGRRAGRAATGTTTGTQDRYDRTRSRSRRRRGWSSRASAAEPPLIAAYITVLVWVEVDDELRLARGLARDGAEMREHWLHVHGGRGELFFGGTRTRERADVWCDGTGARPPVVR